MLHKPLPVQFFEQQSTLELARSLLGTILVKETEEGVASGWIVETEAYIGPHDQAAHSFGNLRTKRTEVMFGPPGYIYTYVMHTHCLVNIVSGKIEHPEAVLIRAVEPYMGIDLMYERRGKEKKEKELTSGPGKLTKALGIIKGDYGLPCFNPPLYIAEGKIAGDIETGPRVGIGNSGKAKDYPWRFWIKENPFVSVRSR